jgi:hypothetical protein
MGGGGTGGGSSGAGNGGWGGSQGGMGTFGNSYGGDLGAMGTAGTMSGGAGGDSMSGFGNVGAGGSGRAGISTTPGNTPAGFTAAYGDNRGYSNNFGVSARDARENPGMVDQAAARYFSTPIPTVSTPLKPALTPYNNPPPKFSAPDPNVISPRDHYARQNFSQPRSNYTGSGPFGMGSIGPNSMNNLTHPSNHGGSGFPNLSGKESPGRPSGKNRSGRI